LLTWVLLALGSGHLFAQTKVASYARVDLTATTTVGYLTNAQVLIGDGPILRQHWRSTAEWPRTYTIELGIVRWEWTQLSIRFEPQRSGQVELKLMGLYELLPGSASQIYRQEVLFDAFTASGVTVPNASFETVSGGTISGWQGGTSQSTSANVPVVSGTRCARVWHDNPMTANLSVRAGVPVTLTFYARAHVPSSFVEMQRVSDPNTPAHRAALRYARGINFGNSLEMAPGSGGTLVYDNRDYALARGEGFDHVRLPVGWHHYTGPAPNYTLDATIFTKVDAQIGFALANGLGMIIDWHNFDALSGDFAANTNEFLSVWRQIAARYAGRPAALAFELISEPFGKATTALLNGLYAETLRQIRPSHPERIVFLSPSAYNGIDELTGLLLPDHDQHLIATVHEYNPFYFTHQGASWAGPDPSTLGVLYPGPPATPLQPDPRATNPWVKSWFEFYNSQPTENNPSSPLAFRGRLQRARRWAEWFGRPVHVGEFGCFETADAQARLRFYRDIRETMDAEGLGWAMWDWKAGFHYQKNGLPDPPGMREAIFPPIELRSTGAGVIETIAARGKTFVVERASTLVPPLSWQPLSTQTLATPNFTFADPNATGAAAGFYRVRWVK
jgi:endoglucanase